MINNSNSSDTNQINSQGTSPLNSKSKTNPIGKTTLKQYGRKSLAPMVDLLHKYKDQLNPYIMALNKGLLAASDSFTVSNSSASFQSQSQSQVKPLSQNSDAERIVGGWFRETQEWFEAARGKMSTENPKDLLNYLEDQARDKPGLMFATSYVAGVVFGRLGKHIGRIKEKNASVTVPSSMQGSTLQH